MLSSSSNRKYPPFPLFSYFSVVVCLRCLLHHILSIIVYTFLENREFVLVSTVQFMVSANIRIDTLSLVWVIISHGYCITGERNLLVNVRSHLSLRIFSILIYYRFCNHWILSLWWCLCIYILHISIVFLYNEFYAHDLEMGVFEMRSVEQLPAHSQNRVWEV